MERDRIRNFCIIAHVDHGKSTLADRLLERTGTISERDMTEQVLDAMDLEREKGVTIKASAVRLSYDAPDDRTYELNLIDTPGHVDFGYEVSRALAACEGALLVVDASQGVEAQTIANLYQALEHDLTIIPVINKIDLPSAHPEEVAHELSDLFGFDESEAILVSAKDGRGAEQVLQAIVERIPPPRGPRVDSSRALVFDTHYDSYKGVVAYVRVFDGELTSKTQLMPMATRERFEPIEVGAFVPGMLPVDGLSSGEVGYVATGLKSVHDCGVGDTITLAADPAPEPLPGYRPAKPMVFAGLYPSEGEDYGVLRDSLEKLSLNDASFTWQPENSQALGFGFRAGFLGLFHMEIIQERLEREYGLDLVVTAPNVEYEVVTHRDETLRVDSPADLPPEGDIEEIREPWAEVTLVTPAEHVGAVMELANRRRGLQKRMEYLDQKRVLLTYEMPLSEVIIDLHDQLKSRTRGYGSMDYHMIGFRAADLVRLDVLVNEEPVDALYLIVHRDEAYRKGQSLVTRLKELIPRQMFDVPVQAAVGKRVISRANVKATRKNVTAKCYGGDVTRKRKLLEKQKEGKKRLKQIGSVSVPQEAFMALLSIEES
ncbi:MAG: elongation factor 4 [Anaerolineae bacterium]|nr:elongation factor 4 [Anaerolineae bacterium]